MVIFIKNLIKTYIDNLTIDDLRKYIIGNYGNIDEEEISIIYDCIKNKWEDIYNDNPKVWNELKNKLSPNTYNEIIKLYKKYSYMK